MSNSTKDVTNAGIAGAITGVTIGAAAVLLSDKKRRDSLFSQANKIKDKVKSTTEKFSENKNDKNEVLADLTDKADKKIDEEKENLKKSLI